MLNSKKIERNLNNNTKRKILYVLSHNHVKTSSTEFLSDYLAQFFEVEKAVDDAWQEKNHESYFAIIFFQIFPHIRVFKQIKNDNIIFFPMYDESYNKNFNYFYRYKNCKFINFSKTLHERLKNWGFDSIHVQYFPKVQEKIKDFGSQKSIFLWQRLADININTIDKVIGLENLEHIHLHGKVNPQASIKPENEKKITRSQWLENKEDLYEIFVKSALYFAPRKYEGIGMSFLDAMAFGRCVIAPNNPTMNEYIADGKTGFLYELKNPKKIELKDIKKIQQNTLEYIERGYEKWCAQKQTIIETINRKTVTNFSTINKIRANINPKKILSFKLGKNTYLRIFGKDILRFNK